MTSIEQHDIRCSCGHQFSVRLHESVNTELSPKAVEEFLRGALNRPECPRCHKRLWIFIPVLFNDMEREFMVWVGDRSQPDGYVLRQGRATIVHAAHYIPALAALLFFRADPQNATLPYEQMSTEKTDEYIASYLRLYESLKSDQAGSTAVM